MRGLVTDHGLSEVDVAAAGVHRMVLSVDAADGSQWRADVETLAETLSTAG